MKKILTLALISTLAISGLSAEVQTEPTLTKAGQKELCKKSIEKAHTYQEKAVKNSIEMAAYRTDVVDNCGTLVAVASK